MRFAWKEGARLNVDPQVVGQRLTKLNEQHGQLTAEIVLEDAKDPASPLHKVFEWDDSKAAVQWRLEQARHMIRALVVVEVREEMPPIRAFVHVTDAKGPHYTEMAYALSETDLRRQVLDKALHELELWRARYQELQEFAAFVAEIDNLLVLKRGLSA